MNRVTVKKDFSFTPQPGADTTWESLDTALLAIFSEYVGRIDPEGALGLGRDSVIGYAVGEITR